MPKKFTQEEAARFGLPRFARLEIPLLGQSALAEQAEALSDLAASLARLHRSSDQNETIVVVQAYREIVAANNKLRNQKG